MTADFKPVFSLNETGDLRRVTRPEANFSTTY